MIRTERRSAEWNERDERHRKVACESRARSTWRIEIEPQFDTHFAGDMIGSVPEEKATRGASRYDAVIATLVEFCALCVSGYTAYIQRQQVRGAVWPILQFDSGNGPHSIYSRQQRRRTSDHQKCGSESG
jgi:hypothetical protein